MRLVCRRSGTIAARALECDIEIICIFIRMSLILQGRDAGSAAGHVHKRQDSGS